MKAQTNGENKNTKKNITLTDTRSVGTSRKTFTKNGRTNYSSFALFR